MTKTGQHIHELKSYIINVWDISFGTFKANHLWKKNFGKGRGEKPWLAPWEGGGGGAGGGAGGGRGGGAHMGGRPF